MGLLRNVWRVVLDIYVGGCEMKYKTKPKARKECCFDKHVEKDLRAKVRREIEIWEYIRRLELLEKRPRIMEMWVWRRGSK